MIRNDKEIERLVDPDPETGARMNDRETLRIAKRRVDIRVGHTAFVSVGGVQGMQMGVAPEDDPILCLFGHRRSIDFIGKPGSRGLIVAVLEGVSSLSASRKQANNRCGDRVSRRLRGSGRRDGCDLQRLQTDEHCADRISRRIQTADPCGDSIFGHLQVMAYGV